MEKEDKILSGKELVKLQNEVQKEMELASHNGVEEFEFEEGKIPYFQDFFDEIDNWVKNNVRKEGE